MKNLPYLTSGLLALVAACTVAPTAKRTSPARHAKAPVVQKAPVAVAPTPAPEPELETIAAQCPLAIPGVSITAETSHMGAALVFTGVGDPEPLRGEVTQMAEAHNRIHL